MSSRLILVRHGQTGWNAAGRIQGRSDIPLNSRGRVQAMRAGESLAGSPWDVLVSSPLLRARETAELIGQRLGLRLHSVIPGLVERDYGAAEGKPAAGFRPGELDALDDGAEPAEAVAGRGVEALRGLLTQHPDKAIIAVTHGTLLRLALTDILGRPHPRLENGQVVEVDTQALASPSRL
ncbi:MAG: phosphoglycerate mutase [Pseudarthrobacter sp.]|nr:phosphoglycerate mutase [Pseudarthrobacter sp.]